MNSSRKEFHLGGRSGLGASESDVRSGNDVAPLDPWVSRSMRKRKTFVILHHQQVLVKHPAVPWLAPPPS